MDFPLWEETKPHQTPIAADSHRTGTQSQQHTCIKGASTNPAEQPEPNWRCYTKHRPPKPPPRAAARPQLHPAPH